MSDLFVMSGRPGGYYDRTFGQEAFGAFFHTPQAAEQHWRVLHNHPTPWDYAPRRVTWQEREAAKFEQGMYTTPCWRDEKWWTDPGHFAHVSLDDPTMIAFTENEHKGAKDIQLRMKPGKYLARFFGTVLTPKQIAFFAEWFVKGEKPQGTGLGPIQFASTPEQIEDVYKRGPYSCMRGDAEVRVYGAGDLSVAYVEDATTNKVISRALCWPAKQVFGRVYPTLSSAGYWQHDFETAEEALAVYEDLFHRLRDMGWASYNEGGTLAGARLLRETDDGEYIIGPYVDGYNNVHEDPTGDERYLILGDQTDESREQHGYVSHHSAQNTTGYFGNEPDEDPEYDDDSWSCQRCEDNQDGDDSTYDVYDGWNPLLGANGEESWCRYCARSSDRAFYCEATDTYYDPRATSDVNVTTNSDGDTQIWVGGYADEHAFESDFSSDWFAKTLRVTLHDDTEWSISEFEEYGFTCTYDGKNYSSTEQSTRFPGWPASMDSKPFTHAFRRKHIQ